MTPERHQVNQALERAHTAVAMLEAGLLMLKDDADRERLAPVVKRLKNAIDQAGAALAVARHNAKEAIESL
jgi:hypothetical protein